MLRIFSISPSEWELGSWAAVGNVTCKTACWGGEHCPAGTPNCQQGFVEKTALCYAPMWFGEPSDYMVCSGVTTGRPATVPYQTLPELSIENRTLCQIKTLGYYLGAPYHTSPDLGRRL